MTLRITSPNVSRETFRRLLAIYSIVATVALAVMAQRVKASNRHARIACMLAAAATAASHDYWTTNSTPWN